MVSSLAGSLKGYTREEQKERKSGRQQKYKREQGGDSGKMPGILTSNGDQNYKCMLKFFHHISCDLFSNSLC